MKAGAAVADALSAAELQRRRPVWIALSELWLDTELDDANFAWMAGLLAASRYTRAELRAIHLEEIAPVLLPNLMCMAGEWEGFDEDQLCERVTAQANAWRRRGPWARWFAVHSLTRRLILWSSEGDWRKLMAHLPAEPPPRAGLAAGARPG